MKAFIYVLFGAVLAFVLIALLIRPRWFEVEERQMQRHSTGGYRPDLSPYMSHGGGPYRPGMLY